MSSALHEIDEFSNEEPCPLVADAEEDAIPKILQKRKHAPAFYGFQLKRFQPRLFQINFWTFATCVLIVCLFTTIRRGRSQYQYTYEHGYDTEFCTFGSFLLYYSYHVHLIQTNKNGC